MKDKFLKFLQENRDSDLTWLFICARKQQENLQELLSQSEHNFSHEVLQIDNYKDLNQNPEASKLKADAAKSWLFDLVFVDGLIVGRLMGTFEPRIVSTIRG